MRPVSRIQAAAIASGIPPVEDAAGETWMMTYLDMMTLLLVVTMAMLALAGKGHARPQHSMPPVFTAKALTSVEAPGALLLVPQPPSPEPVVVEPEPEPVAVVEPEPSKPTTQDLLNELPLDQLGNDIEVVTNDSSVSFRISSEILFPSGQSDLNLGGLAVLRKLLPVLDSVPHKLIVAGHTDTQDIRSARFPSNWELSGARAGSVVRYLQANGIQPDRLAAIGYADTHPLADNSTPEGRARNRRVELILER
ncbi:OmpA/MotB family protein [Pseudomonas poae]|uniref:Protein MotD n=1 Tax=Pseudomonas poae TaxID=200451 RepID=A0A2S9EL07_9PSED|nr:OmpA family protein [Pseudomonas poae]PRA26766.1 protein MotD [Pseudomonas poae]PRC15972.1 protein MotD [Pseudomonas poae]